MVKARAQPGLFVWKGAAGAGELGQRLVKEPQCPQKVVSQWPTLWSGPLARRERAGTKSKARKSREPVAHSLEWTTSSPGKGWNQVKSPEKLRASGPLWRVDHWLPGRRRKLGQKPGKGASQWSTFWSGPLAPWEKAETGSKARKRREPVVHSGEWTTSSQGEGRNWVKSPEKL